MVKLTLKAMVVSLAVSTAALAQTQAEIDRWDADWATFQFLSSLPLEARGMVQASQDLPITINGSTKKVFDVYSNVYNALGLHPFLVKLTPIRYTNDRFDFLSYEDIPLPDGTIFNSVSAAQMRFDRAHNVYEVDTFTAPGVITRQRITFQNVGHHQTAVNEHLVFETTPEFIGLATQGGVVAHAIVQQGVKAKIEAGLLHPIRFPRWVPGYQHHNCDEGEAEDD